MMQVCQIYWLYTKRSCALRPSNPSLKTPSKVETLLTLVAFSSGVTLETILDSSNNATSWWFFTAAKSQGVKPDLFSAQGSAPCAKRYSTHRFRPEHKRKNLTPVTWNTGDLNNLVVPYLDHTLLLLCLSGHNKKGPNKNNEVKKPLWKQRNMFGARIKIM